MNEYGMVLVMAFALPPTPALKFCIYRHWNLPRSRNRGGVRGIRPFRQKFTELAIIKTDSRKMSFLLRNIAKLGQIYRESSVKERDSAIFVFFWYRNVPVRVRHLLPK